MEKISLNNDHSGGGGTAVALAPPPAARRPRYGDEWRLLASCRDLDTDLFFDNGLTEAALAQQELAKSVCRECVVRSDCLEFALMTNQQFGIWGGATEEERREIRRSRRRAARRVSAPAAAAAGSASRDAGRRAS